MVFLSQPFPRQSVRRRSLVVPPCFHVLYKVHEFHPSESRSSRYVIFYPSMLLAVLKDGSSSYFTIEKACDSQILQADHGKTLPPTLELWMQNRNQFEASAVTRSLIVYKYTIFWYILYIYACLYVFVLTHTSHFWKTSYLSTYISYLCGTLIHQLTQSSPADQWFLAPDLTPDFLQGA